MKVTGKIKHFFGLDQPKYTSDQKGENILYNHKKVEKIFENYELTTREKVSIFRAVRHSNDFAKGKKRITQKDLDRTNKVFQRYLQKKSVKKRLSKVKVHKNAESEQFKSGSKFDKMCREHLDKCLSRYDPKKAAKELISPARFRHSWLKLFALNAAYVRFEPGETLPIYNRIGAEEKETQFVVKRVIETKKSLGITVLVPQGKNAKDYEPVVLVRGTQFDGNGVDYWDMRNDLKKDIGTLSYEPNKAKIQHMLKDLAKEYGPVTITGHSLGGKVAQLMYCDNLDHMIEVDDPGNPTGKKEISVVKEAVFFGSPGTTFKRLEAYREKKYQMELKGYDVPEGVDYYLSKDIAHTAGGPHLYTKRFLLRDKSLKFRFSFNPAKFIANMNRFFIKTHRLNKKELYELKYERHRYRWYSRGFKWVMERIRFVFRKTMKLAFRELFKQQNIFYFFDSEGTDKELRKG